MEQEIKIPLDAIVKITRCGYDTEIMYSSRHSHGGTARKVSGSSYVLLDRRTGEISEEKEYKKTQCRNDSIENVKQSLKKVREYIYTNCTDLKKCKWITLTYRYPMTDLKKLTNDFKNYNTRCRKKYGPYEYIAVSEPQENGNWHLHCILIFSHTAPYMDRGEVSYDLWQQGNADVHNIDNITNLAAYLTCYLTDIESEDNNNNKKHKKGARLILYPTGCNIYRCSRGIRKPIVYYDTYMNAISDSIGEMTYRNTKCISKNDFECTLIYENYHKTSE